MAFFEQLAGGFNKVTKDFTNKAQEIGSKAQELTEIAKLKAKMNDESNAIKSAYAEIGKAYYEAYKDREDAICAEKFSVIKEAEETIEKLKKEITDRKGMKLCTVCGGEIAKGACFCPRCGSKQEEETVVEETTEQTETEGVEETVLEEAKESIEETAAEETKEEAAVEEKEIEVEVVLETAKDCEAE